MDKFSFLYRHPQTRVLLVTAVIFQMLSWLRAGVVDSIMVDYHPLSGLPLWITFFTFLAALAANTLALYRLWRSPDLSASQIRIATYVLLLIYSLMLPMLSNDLYSLLGYGDATLRGGDVYTDTAALHLSAYYEYVSPLWRQAPCVYGPVCLTTSRLAAQAGAGNIYLAMVVYKILALAWAGIFVECTMRVSRILHLSVRTLALILLNPIFMIQAVGQLHCDTIAIALVACMVYSLVSGRWYAAFIFAGLAVGSKMSYVLILPFLVGGLFIYKKSWLDFFTRGAAGILLTAATLFLIYLPYYTSTRTFSVPFTFLTHQNPAKSASEIIGDVVYFAPRVLSGNSEAVTHSIQRPSGVEPDQLRTWLAVKIFLQLFALVTSAALLYRFWRSQHSFLAWCRTYVRLLLLFLLFYAHVLYPWYLLFILPLLLEEANEKFVQWLLVMLGLAIVQDLMTFTSHETFPYYCLLILTFSSIMSFFWRFRTVYFRSHAPDS